METRSRTPHLSLQFQNLTKSTHLVYVHLQRYCPSLLLQGPTDRAIDERDSGAQGTYIGPRGTGPSQL